MRCLLDTHVWIWSQEELGNIGPKTEEILLGPDNDLYVSPISTLEIARLIDLGQISIKGTLKSWIQQSVDNLLAVTLELSHEIAIEAYSLDKSFHKDPADRILVASAIVHDMTIITADGRILSYPQVSAQNAQL